MGQYIRRPNASTWYGEVEAYGSTGVSVLGDQNDANYLHVENVSSYYGSSSSSSGAYVQYPALAGPEIPAGREIVAVKVGHRFRAGGTSSSYKYPPISYIRNASGARIQASQLYQSDGFSRTWRDQVGPPIYKSGASTWSIADINAFTTEFTLSSNTSYGDVDISEHYMVVTYEEPLVTPTMSFPASGATVDTSNVPLSAVAPAPQADQIVRAVFQIATNSAFTAGVRTFYGPYHGNTSAGYVTALNSNPDIGPGMWYVRVKLQDAIGNETVYSAPSTFTVAHAALPVPALVSPAPGSTQTTPYGVRTGRVATAASDARKVKVQWQFSKSSTFASGNVAYTATTLVDTGDLSYDSSGDSSQYLSQGTWYGRICAIDKWGQVSDWSSSATFTVSHPPLAQNVSPTSSSVIDQTVTPVRWTFGDAWNGDSQTAYQIKVYNDSNTLVHDTGKLGSTGSPNQSLQHFLAIDSSYLYQNMRYMVTLWDKDNASRSDAASNYFVFSHSPAITSSYPAANEVVLTGQPQFVWNPGIGRPGTSQKSYELKIYNTGTGNLIYTTGVVTNSTARSHTPPQVILRNMNNYREELRIVDSDGLSSTLVRNFSAEYQPPPEPIYTVDPLTAEFLGYVTVDWAGTIPDDYFTAWKIYRRAVGAISWDLIETINDTSVYQYHDWLVPSVEHYQYVVTQMADRSGFILESPINEEAPSNFVSSTDYWFIDPEDETQNVRLYNVTGDNFTDAVESNAYHVKGRGTRVNFGDYLGMNGTLKAQIRPSNILTTRQQRAALKAIQLGRGWMYMRDPFGNITKIAILDVSVDRIPGTSNQEEFADVTIPYQEVF